MLITRLALLATGLAPAAAQCPSNDVFEPNDSCPGAQPLGDGVYPGLEVGGTDRDFFLLSVPAGGTVEAFVSFAHALGDIDLYLWDPVVACDSTVAGTGSANGSVAQGLSSSDNESVLFTNLTGTDLDLVLELTTASGVVCNGYTLQVLNAQCGCGGGEVTTTTCSSLPNSTGQVGALAAYGSAAVADNDVTLVATQLPPGRLGIFLVAPEPANIFLFDSILCLGGGIGRYTGPGQVFITSPGGEASLVLDLTQTPTPTGPVAIQPGESWYFQAWHREVPGVTAKFSDGRELLFH